MYLRDIELRGFRNYQQMQAEFRPGVVVLHGPNGAGKTNVLEAICVAATGHSPRARAAGEIVGSGCQHAFVRAEVAGAEEHTRIEVGLALTGERQIKIQGAVRRQADLIGVAPVVYFSTDDIGVVRGEPGGRRRLIDRELSAVSRSYYFNLVRYRRAIHQRNQLLKELRRRPGGGRELGVWDSAAAGHGARVMVARGDFIEALAPQARDAHVALTGAGSPFVMRYRPSIELPNSQSPRDRQEDMSRVVGETASNLLRVFEETRRADILNGVTGHGPHRDDVDLMLGAHPARTFGSQGEQRTCAVAMRMALATVVHRLTGKRPLLLLDDVLSELDERRRAGVFTACGESEQVIITCCDEQDIPDDVRRSALVFAVGDGQLR
jgi:DNA replication and repair protein RecF